MPHLPKVTAQVPKFIPLFLPKWCLFSFFNLPSWVHWPHMFGQPAFNFQITQKALAPLYREFSRESHLNLRDARSKGHVHPWTADNHGTFSQIAEGRKYIGLQIGRARQMLQIGLPSSLNSTCLKIISSFSHGIAVFLQGFPWIWFSTKTHRVHAGVHAFDWGSGIRGGLAGHLQGDSCVYLVFLRVFLHSDGYFS